MVLSDCFGSGVFAEFGEPLWTIDRKSVSSSADSSPILDHLNCLESNFHRLFGYSTGKVWKKRPLKVSSWNDHAVTPSLINNVIFWENCFKFSSFTLICSLASKRHPGMVHGSSFKLDFALCRSTGKGTGRTRPASRDNPVSWWHRVITWTQVVRRLTPRNGAKFSLRNLLNLIYI